MFTPPGTPLSTAPSSAPTPWLQTVAPRPAARLRLLCFHPAGAGPHFYRPWAAQLPADIEVSAVNLPGREARYNEPLLGDYTTALSSLYAALRQWLGADRRPYALFGHSMGALLAYGVALTAARLGDPAPERLLLSGVGGPGTEQPKAGRAEWSDAELVADLREMGGTPEEVLGEPELLSLILPVLRADYGVCDSFRATPPTGPLLNCPLTLLGGADDHATPPQLARWAEVTAGPTTQYTFPGGHFYLTQESSDAVLATLAAELRAPARRPG
ncbi:thioesterase II family protein [Streptacidiphilus anmyonensis]|uniref:thioesterase II family protein n=1 Tax=Streptacidiphilus anmyonensis TaxID=405782 RepID=UPI000694D924|nr:alpha/beta fold hydrolase [Streptacidiphilus anmyonensis]